MKGLSGVRLAHCDRMKASACRVFETEYIFLTLSAALFF